MKRLRDPRTDSPLQLLGRLAAKPAQTVRDAVRSLPALLCFADEPPPSETREAKGKRREVE